MGKLELIFEMELTLLSIKNYAYDDPRKRRSNDFEMSHQQ